MTSANGSVIVDGFERALAALAQLDNESSFDERHQVAQIHTSAFIVEASARHEFGEYAMGRLEACGEQDPPKSLSDHLIIALAERSRYQNQACNYALNFLTSNEFPPEDGIRQHEASVIVTGVTAFYSGTYRSDVDRYALSQMVMQASWIAPKTKLLAIVTLLPKAQSAQQARQSLSIKQAIEHLVGEQGARLDQKFYLPSIFNTLVDNFDLEEWALWIPELLLDEDVSEPGASSRRTFLDFCFRPGKPIFVLIKTKRQVDLNPIVLLVARQFLDKARSKAEIIESALEHGSPLDDRPPNDWGNAAYFDPLEDALIASMSWVASHIAKSRGESNVISFPGGAIENEY